QGEEWGKALDYLVQSGQRAQHTYANQAALDYYARAIEAAGRAQPQVPVRQILDIRQQRSQVFIGITRYADAIHEAEDMVEQAHRSGERRTEGTALAQLAFAHWATLSADHVPAVERFTDEALAIAREVED